MPEITGPLLVCGFIGFALVVALLIDRRDIRARKRRAAQDARERLHTARMIDNVRRWDR